MPWIPQAVLDVLLDAARAPREAPVLACRCAETLQALEKPAPTAKPVTAAEAPPSLPPDVVDACLHYAFDDAEEQQANFRRAELMLKAGKTPKAIVEAIRIGAPVGAFL